MSGEGPSRGGCANYKIVDNKRGKTLLHAGHSYTIHRKNQNSIVWTCVNKRKSVQCRGAVKVSHENDIVHIQHKHSSQCTPNFLANEIHSLLNDSKEEICNNFNSVKKTYETNVMNMKKVLKEKGSFIESFAEIPEFESIKNQLYRARNKKLNVPKTQFKEPSDVIIPKKIQSFLLIDYAENGNRILVFASESAQKHIEHVQHFFGDGTFDCCAKPFIQIYTIHGDIGSDVTKTNIAPLFYVLLCNKEKRTYETMLIKIKEALPNFNPIKFTLDFEAAAMNAIKTVFPETIIRGCFVHFQRSVMRKARSLGLLEHEEPTQHVKLCTSLAFLPKEDIEDGWLLIMENR